MQTKQCQFKFKRFFHTNSNKDFSTMGAQSRIFHLTDTEGHASAFINAINKSDIVACSESLQLSFKKGKGTPYFIFGGDAQDRGSYDLTTLKPLIRFKQQYPDQVILIVGNRDITKNRLKIELDPLLIRERLLFSQSPRWLPADKPTLPLDYVTNLMREKGYKGNLNEEMIKIFVNQLSIKQCQFIYMRWMFEKTMGCPNAVRYRREELSRLRNTNTISEEDILDSYLFETSPEGLSGMYLRLAQPAAIIPNTQVLAIHGGIKPTSLGRVPGCSEHFEKLEDWVNGLNGWYQKQIQEWISIKSTQLTIPACTALDQSVLPIAGQDKFIITEDNLGKNREFIEVDNSVTNYLAKNNINLVLTGHQPIGDHPAILRHSKVLFINGDTGYAKSNPKNPDDTRGPTCHALDVTATPDETSISIKATLSDSTSVSTKLKITAKGVVGDPYIGTIVPDEGLVQCQLQNNLYRIANQKGFTVTYHTLSAQELEARLTEENLNVSRM